MVGMKEQGQTAPGKDEISEPAFSRFQHLARALFRVEKKDVEKHEPKKRRSSLRTPDRNYEGQQQDIHDKAEDY